MKTFAIICAAGGVALLLLGGLFFALGKAQEPSPTDVFQSDFEDRADAANAGKALGILAGVAGLAALGLAVVLGLASNSSSTPTTAQPAYGAPYYEGTPPQGYQHGYPPPPPPSGPGNGWPPQQQ